MLGNGSRRGEVARYGGMYGARGLKRVMYHTDIRFPCGCQQKPLVIVLLVNLKPPLSGFLVDSRACARARSDQPQLKGPISSYEALLHTLLESS